MVISIIWHNLYLPRPLAAEHQPEIAVMGTTRDETAPSYRLNPLCHRLRVTPPLVVDHTAVKALLGVTNLEIDTANMISHANAPAASRVETTDEKGIPLRKTARLALEVTESESHATGAIAMTTAAREMATTAAIKSGTTPETSTAVVVVVAVMKALRHKTFRCHYSTYHNNNNNNKHRREGNHFPRRNS